MKIIQSIITLGKFFTYIILVIIFSIVACRSQKSSFDKSQNASKKEQKKKSDKGYVDKDIDKFYPEFESIDMEKYRKNIDTVRPSGHMKSELKAIVDTLAKENKRYKYAQGYRIQIYSGTNKIQANHSKERAYEILRGVNVYKKYISPNYKVRVGDYLDRLEAFQNRQKLLEEFPNALVVPDKINLQRN